MRNQLKHFRIQHREAFHFFLKGHHSLTRGLPIVGGRLFFLWLKLACWNRNWEWEQVEQELRVAGTGKNWKIFRIASDYRLGQRSILCAGNKKVFTAATPPLFPAPRAAWCELNNNLITKWIRSRSDVQPTAILKTRKLKLELKNLLEKRSSKSNLAKNFLFTLKRVHHSLP